MVRDHNIRDQVTFRQQVLLTSYSFWPTMLQYVVILFNGRSSTKVQNFTALGKRSLRFAA
jgi:hypothetical protein